LTEEERISLTEQIERIGVELRELVDQSDLENLREPAPKFARQWRGSPSRSLVTIKNGLRTTQLQFLQVEITACSIYLHIARTSHSSQHGEEALANAVDAYAAVNNHISDAGLTEEDTTSVRNWLGETRKELQDFLAT